MNRSTSIVVAIPVLLAALLAGCRYTRHQTVSGLALGGVDAQRVETVPLTIAPGGTLQVSTPHGRIEVRAELGAAPKLVATLRAGGRTEEEAQEVLRRHSLVVDGEGERVAVSVRGEPMRIRDDGVHVTIGASVDCVVTVPEGTALQIDTSSGDIRATGPLGACKLHTRQGSIDLDGVRGDVDLRSESGDVTVRDAAGGDVIVDSGYGALLLEKLAAASLRASSKSGNVTLHDGRADQAALTTSHGSIRVRGSTGELRAETRSGDVEVVGARGAVNVRTEYGKVAVEGELTAVEARTASGTVAVKALPGSANATDWQLSSSHGAVSLWVPADFGCEFAATTQYGEIDCDFPVLVEGGRRQSGQWRGRVGGGGHAVTLTTGSGDIAMKKL